MENLPERIKKYRGTLRPATIKTYATNIRRLAKLLDSNLFEKKVDDIKNLTLSPSVKKTLVTAGITYEKMNGNKCPKLAVLLKELDKEAKAIVS